MSRSSVPRRLSEPRYYAAAQEYLRYLREHCPEHFMEGTPSATQRKITVESFDLVHARRPEVQVFNELLVQYPGPDNTILRVVSDNMVVLHDQPLPDMLSFNVPLQDARPFWMLEYVTTESERKDYEANFAIYERDLRVPFYLIFYPQTQDLSLYRLNTRRRYSSVKPATNGRYPVADLDMEVAIHDGWVRFWHNGELLPLPADLLHELEATRQQLAEERRLLEQERQRSADLQAEVTRLQALLAKKSNNSTGS
jgi:Uma2 family endonuclease